MSNNINLKDEVIEQIFVFKYLLLELIIDRVGDFGGDCGDDGGCGGFLEQASDLKTGM